MNDVHSSSGAVNHDVRAYLLLTVTTLCWGANAILAKLAVGEISPMLLVSLRWLGVVILLLIFSHKSLIRDWPILRHHLIYICLMGALGFTAFNALFYIAAHASSAINIGILQGSIPVFVLLGTFFLYHFRATRIQIYGVAITLIGVVIIASGGDINQLTSLSFNQGDVYMLMACLLYAGYSIGLSRRPAVSAMGLFSSIAIVAFIASIPLLAVEIGTDKFQPPTTTGWVIVVLVSLLPSFIAQVFFIHGVSLIGPARAGIFVNLVPVFASIMAVVFLHETFETFHAVSLGLVLGGIGLSELGKKTIVDVR